MTAGSTVTVSVTFFAGFRRSCPRARRGRSAMRCRCVRELADLLDVIGIDTAADATVAVNGEIATRGDAASDSAEADPLPPMEGGIHGRSRSVARDDRFTRYA